MADSPTHEGRVAVATGSPRGILAAIVAGLARRGAGVVAADLTLPGKTAAAIDANAGAAAADVSSFGLMVLTKNMWPHPKASGGTIVNTASLTGYRVFRTLGGPAHVTATMNIVGMAKRLTMEGGGHGMHANSISSGESSSVNGVDIGLDEGMAVW